MQLWLRRSLEIDGVLDFSWQKLLSPTAPAARQTAKNAGASGFVRLGE
jgi:hypothetical protein